MSDLVAFLVACLDDDEATARAATDEGFGWRLADVPGSNEVWAARDAAGHDAFMVATTATRLNPHPGWRGLIDATHIARHDPARVLVEVDAKRRIIEAAAAGNPADQWMSGLTLDWVLRLLVLPYVGRPGFDERWLP